MRDNLVPDEWHRRPSQPEEDRDDTSSVFKGGKVEGWLEQRVLLILEAQVRENSSLLSAGEVYWNLPTTPSR